MFNLLFQFHFSSSFTSTKTKRSGISHSDNFYFTQEYNIFFISNFIQKIIIKFCLNCLDVYIMLLFYRYYKSCIEKLNFISIKKNQFVIFSTDENKINVTKIEFQKRKIVIIGKQIQLFEISSMYFV